MSNELHKNNYTDFKHFVKFHIDLNNAEMKKWTAIDHNIYNTVLSVVGKEINEKDNNYIVNLSELKSLSEYKRTNLAYWHDQVVSTSKKIMSIKLESTSINDEDKMETHLLSVFSEVKISSDKETMTVTVNPTFKFLLLDLKSKYVFYDLESITVGLKHKFSKALYPHLMQWKKIGAVTFEIEKFKRIIDTNYSNRDINSKILPVLEKDLNNVFNNLSIERIHNKRKKGNPVEKYKFLFTPIGFDENKYKSEESNENKGEIVEDELIRKKRKTIIKEDIEFYTHRFIEEEKDIIYFEHLKPRRTKGGELHYYLDGEGILYTCFLDKDKKPIKMQVDGREYKLNSKMREIYEDYKIENMDYDEVYDLIGRNVSISYLRKKNVKENTISNIVNKIKFVQKALKENDENSEDYIYLAKPTMPIYRKEPDYWMDLDENRSFADWAFRNIAAENLSNKLVREFKEDYLTYNELFKEFKNKYKLTKAEGKTVKLVEWNWQKDPDKTELYYIENQKKNEELNIEPPEQDLADEIF